MTNTRYIRYGEHEARITRQRTQMGVLHIAQFMVGPYAGAVCRLNFRKPVRPKKFLVSAAAELKRRSDATKNP